MATNTTKLGLIKPDFVDVVDITDLNTNADDIDAAVGFTICTSSTRPSTPWTGQSIFETDTESSFIWDGTAWKPGGGGGSIEISATAPSSPGEGDLWWDSDNGNLYIYYDDGDSQQWVAANGPQVFVGTTAPPGYQGQLWFDSTQGKTYIYYDDGTSAQWISAIGGSLSGNVIQVVSAFTATTTTTTSASFVNTSLTASITPRSTSSQIVVLVSVSQLTTNSNAGGSYALLVRGNASSRLADLAQSTLYTNPTQDLRVPFTIFSIDSPSSTSSTQYSLLLASADSPSNTASVAGAQRIILMEVAG